MKSTGIAPGIYWVGFVDWNVRDFHGYSTSRGSSYNAYLIVDEKIALVDAVKGGYSYDLMAKIAERVDPAKIDYIISNHTEPDHSGEIARVLAAAPNAVVVATDKGRQGLEHYYGGNWNYQIVSTGDSISLGKYTLQFISTPMLHWPDSMFTYIPQLKLLFSMDAFGQHFAQSKRFDHEVDYNALMYEAKVYYANIIMHLGAIVKKTLKQAAGLPIDMIAPSHGVIWTRHIADIIGAYQDWADCKPVRKVLVIYDTMWKSTELMAKAIAEGINDSGITVQVLLVTANDITHLATETLDCAALVVGTPTLNNCMLPTIASFLTYIKGLRPKGKLGLAFGSFGWSGGAVEQAEQMLKDTGVDLFAPAITCKYKPDSATLELCRKTGKELGEKIAGIIP